MVMQTSTCFPTISNRGRAMRFDKVLFAGMAPKPQPALDASDYQQKLQQRERGLAWKHCRDLERLRTCKAVDREFQCSSDYKILQGISRMLLQLLAAVASGNICDRARLEDSLENLLQKHIKDIDSLSPFDMNCAMAVQFDRGELGLCLPEVVNMLPHDTPGSYSWFQRVIAAEMKEVFLTNERFHRRLNPAGVTYDHMELIKSCCDNIHARCGTHIPVVGFSRTTAPATKEALLELAQVRGLGFHRSEGTWSFTRDNVAKVLEALLVGNIDSNSRVIEDITQSLSPAARANGCDLELSWRLILSIDAFNALSRRKEKALACYVGPNGKMAVLGLAVGGDDRDNVAQSFGTPSQQFSDSDGLEGYNSLFGQIEKLVITPFLLVDLPGHLPDLFRERRLYLKLCWMFILDQPAMLAFLALDKEGYACTGKRFNPFSPETRQEHWELYVYYNINTGLAYNPVTKRWECLSPKQHCQDDETACNNCKVDYIKDKNPAAWGLTGNRLHVNFGEETINTLCHRTCEFPECFIERNGVPANFGLDQPLQQLPTGWQGAQVRDWLHSKQAAQHPVVQAMLQGGSIITLFRKPAYGHPKGYPDALIKSPHILSMIQVPFMHMAKGIVGRWTSRLWQQCLTLDAADRLRAEAQGVPRDTSGCAADVDEDQEEPATLDDVAAAVSGNMQDFFLSDKPRCRGFIRGTVLAGNTMEVYQSSSAKHGNDFEELSGNKDFRPLMKLLTGRHYLMSNMTASERAGWEAAGKTLEDLIKRVWFEGCSTDDHRAEATGLALKFVWQFSQVQPVSSFNNYTLMLLQWPFIQPDQRNEAVVDGSARFVPLTMLLLQRPPLKETSDEHGEAMHRVAKSIKHNQGGGIAPLVHPGTREDVQSTVSRDLLGLQQISRTFSIIDLERADPRLPPRARQRSERYKQRPSAIDPDLTVYEVLLQHCQHWQLRHMSRAELQQYSMQAGVSDQQAFEEHEQRLVNAAVDTGLTVERVKAWLRGQRWPREYQRCPRMLPPRTTAVQPAANTTAAVRKRKHHSRPRTRNSKSRAVSVSEVELAATASVEADDGNGAVLESPGRHAVAVSAGEGGVAETAEAAAEAAAVAAKAAVGTFAPERSQPEQSRQRRSDRKQSARSLLYS